MTNTNTAEIICEAKDCDNIATQSIIYQAGYNSRGHVSPDPTQPKVTLQVCSGCWWYLNTLMWGCD